jgi:hypothetical protein
VGFTARGGACHWHNVGRVTTGGEFCLQIDSGSSLETWAGQLSPDPTTGASRWAAALFNRSPSTDVITLDFGQLPGRVIKSAGSFQVRNVWANTTAVTSDAQVEVTVLAHDTALLVVTEI